MDTTLVVGYFTPLSPEAAAALVKGGFVPPQPPPPAGTAPPPKPPPLQPLSDLQAQIWAALTDRPLNTRQTALLEIYWRARKAGEPALPVEEAAQQLASAVDLEPDRAVDYVKGSLRSFGRRLLKALKRPPVRIGYNRMGEGVGDEIPLLALLSIETGLMGEARHRLTDDGFVAVTAALGMTAHGMAAGGILTGDPALDDPDAVVTPAMTRMSYALILRVQESLGLSIDETIKALTAKAGAG